MPRITLLLGKRPKPGTLLDAVADLLVSAGPTVNVLLPHDHAVAIDDLRDETLVVQRGLRDDVSALLDDAHAAALPLCNPWPSERLLRDRMAWRGALEAAGIPIPDAIEVPDWDDVLSHAGSEQVVVKSLVGPGRGETVMPGSAATLPATAPFDGPYLVEELLEFDQVDRKLYVIGGEVRGLLKGSTLEHTHSTSGDAFTPGPELAELALRTRAALDAHLVGVDVVETPAGAVVVDVNSFPGYRGVEDAERLVAEHLLSHITA